jgi:hypothetical protein
LERKTIRVDDNVQKFEVDDLIWVNDLVAMDQQYANAAFASTRGRGLPGTGAAEF